MTDSRNSTKRADIEMIARAPSPTLSPVARRGWGNHLGAAGRTVFGPIRTGSGSKRSGHRTHRSARSKKGGTAVPAASAGVVPSSAHRRQTPAPLRSDEQRGPAMPGTYRPVPAQVDLPAMEHEVLDFWRAENVFAASLERTQDGKRWTFFEGPPTAKDRKSTR